MKKFILLLAITYPAFGCMSLLANNAISVSPGKYSDYYHIVYALTGSNFKIPKNTDPSYNGQFEILLNQSSFPVKSLNCKSELILRMPATLKDSIDSEKNINEKILIFNKIQDVSKNKSEGIDVVIELNPYVLVKSKNPLVLELENCNIFFRTNNNKYVNHL